MNTKATPTNAELAARLDSLAAENAVLRANSRVPMAPTTEREVTFTALAVHTVNGDSDRPTSETVGMPGETKSLRSDRADAWQRRGKCVPADSEAAKAFLGDKKRVQAATDAAEEELHGISASERKRVAKEQELADIAAAKAKQKK